MTGVEQLDVAGAGGEIVAERDAVLQMENFAIRVLFRYAQKRLKPMTRRGCRAVPRG